MKSSLASGTVHKMPADLRQAIISDPKVHALWEDITPLARNEWICWVISGAKAETRQHRIKVGMSKMRSGMRRPCCWIGCIHRKDKSISRSVKWVLDRRNKKSKLSKT